MLVLVDSPADGVRRLTLDRPENLSTILNGHTRLLPGGGVKTLIVTFRGIRPGA